jgi:hypothetical protein
LEVFNLEDFYPLEIHSQIDISQFFSKGFLLKEKDFQEELKNHGWLQYKEHYVAMHCSTAAIVHAFDFIFAYYPIGTIRKENYQWKCRRFRRFLLRRITA